MTTATKEKNPAISNAYTWVQQPARHNENHNTAKEKPSARHVQQNNDDDNNKGTRQHPK